MSAVDTYDCPVPGCDFNVSAVGPQDPDEPDYFAEDIEQHERGHEPAPRASSQAGLQAVMHTPTISSGGAVTTASPAPSGAPSLVELDRQEARNRVVDAAFVLDDVTRTGNDTAITVATDALLDAVREARRVIVR